MNNRFLERPRSFCALGGALQTANALPETVPVMHTAMGCGGSIFWNQIGGTGYLGAGYCGGLAVPSSNVQEKDIVFGGVERLTEQVEHTIKLVEGRLYIVMTGCMTDIIGDDIQSVVKQFRQQGVAIIGAETGGFKGDGYKGYDLVLQALFRDFLVPKPQKVKGKVNLWGVVPAQDAFWRGNLNNLRQLLNKLGLTVNSFFTEFDGLDAIQNAAEAELNIIVSDYYGIDAARVFQEIHQVPFVSYPLPIGPSATNDFLKTIGARLQINPETVDHVIAGEQKMYYHYIDRIADAYNDLDMQRYAVVVGDGNYAPALTRFLADDLGWLTELTVVTEFEEPERRTKITGYLDNLSSRYPVELIYETDASEIQYHLARKWPAFTGQKFYDALSPAFVVGSHHERELAKSIGAGHLTVSFPVGNRVILNKGYTGYLGGLALIEDLFSVIVAER
jgi:nitrogenase molybdenum-iron protein beta chain